MPAALARTDPEEEISAPANVVLLDIHRLTTHRAGVAPGGCCGVPGCCVGHELSLRPLDRLHMLAGVPTVVMVWAIAPLGAGDVRSARAMRIAYLPDAGPVIDGNAAVGLKDGRGFDVTW